MGEHKQSSGVLTTWFSVTFFAQLGVLLRLALTQLSALDDHQMSSTLYSNFLGCAAIAFVNAAKPVFDSFKLAPMYYGISAGFCGALTTFSTWNMEVARWLVGWPSPSLLAIEGGVSAFSGLSAALTELGVSCVGYQLGRAVAEWAEVAEIAAPNGEAILHQAAKAFSAEQKGDRTPALRRRALPLPATAALAGGGGGRAAGALQHRRTSSSYMHGADAGDDDDGDEDFTSSDDIWSFQRRAYIFWFTVIPATLVGYAWTLPEDKRQTVFFMLFFAPPGALLRYYLGTLCNGLPQNFKAGTFYANVGACVLLALLTVFRAQQGCFVAGQTSVEPWWGDVVSGMTVGFCGSLSTMSTLVAQMYEMDMAHGFAYVAASLAASQAALLAILGLFLSDGPSRVCA